MQAKSTQGQGTQTPRTPVQRSQQPRPARQAPAAPQQRQPAFDDRPVEYWPTAAIRAALETDDMAVWQRIVAAIKRDPYGRTARQVEEVLQTARPYGVSKALSEVLVRTREHLEATERAEVARQIQAMLRRSELQAPEFASRIGISNESFADYLEGTVSPPASLLLRMQRLSDRFAKLAAQRSGK
ncbi:XRE family transcriptional regulator [Mycolicibacterium sp. HK-90]|uniref:XRE family transcriptional regulator n=1 Tax=Mycolicibacterium sp. HK-90 TaxID=3056937 RepID=UPI00265A8ADE|nr:XRE family transcriptional regulator [Mycolicibacterium sp. HK-90]WKG06804.1 XRE family transcriptional regulator [Mycolicibacterium sp. HK-90]